MGRCCVSLDFGDDIAAQYFLRKLSAVPGGDEMVPGILLLDQMQLRGEVDGCLGLKAVNYPMIFTIEKHEFDAS